MPPGTVLFWSPHQMPKMHLRRSEKFCFWGKKRVKILTCHELRWCWCTTSILIHFLDMRSDSNTQSGRNFDQCGQAHGKSQCQFKGSPRIHHWSGNRCQYVEECLSTTRTRRRTRRRQFSPVISFLTTQQSYYDDGLNIEWMLFGRRVYNDCTRHILELLEDPCFCQSREFFCIMIVQYGTICMEKYCIFWREVWAPLCFTTINNYQGDMEYWVLRVTSNECATFYLGERLALKQK